MLLKDSKKIIFFLIFVIFLNHAHAFDLDETVDDELRKNYNSSKLIEPIDDNNHALNKSMEETESLPQLPNIVKSDDNISKPANSNTVYKPTKSVQKANLKNIKITKGSTIEVYNTNQISDWQSRGANVQFKLRTSKNTRRLSIPQSTIFLGEVVNSHQPQVTCNGGLVVIKIHSMRINSETIPINAYVVKANDKNIYFNNIKGERTFLKTAWAKGNWGRTLFNKMMTLTINLGSEGSTLVLSPFPFAYGTLCLGLNTLTSPITAFFSKGKHISIPAGSPFKIRFTSDFAV